MDEAVSGAEMLFDLLLAVLVVWLAWGALTSRSSFRAVVLFVSFGLSMALVWVRLDAPDVALAEIAVSAGLTGALFLAALGRVDWSPASVPGDAAIPGHRFSHAVVVLILLSTFAGLTIAVLSLPPEACGLAERVEASLASTCVANPVTATLLYFRGYDTMLELAVLLLAIVAIRATCGIVSPLRRTTSEIWAVMTGLFVPIMILIAGYLLWAGADAAGGAFQAGAVLAASGVLMVLAGVELRPLRDGLLVRFGLAFGLGFFVSLGIAGAVAGDAFLDHPAFASEFVIVILEGAAMVSIGLALLEMFGTILRGRRSRTGGRS